MHTCVFVGFVGFSLQSIDEGCIGTCENHPQSHAVRSPMFKIVGCFMKVFRVAFPSWDGVGELTPFI